MGRYAFLQGLTWRSWFRVGLADAERRSHVASFGDPSVRGRRMRTPGVFVRRDEDRRGGLLRARQTNGRREEYPWRGVTDFSRLACVRAVGRRSGDARTRRQWPRSAAQCRPADFVPLAAAAVETTRPPINRAALSSWRNVFFQLAHRTSDVAYIFQHTEKILSEP